MHGTYKYIAMIGRLRVCWVGYYRFKPSHFAMAENSRRQACHIDDMVGVEIDKTNPLNSRLVLSMLPESRRKK